MTAYAYAGLYLITVALLILAVGIASQLRQARNEARDQANESEEKAEHWMTRAHAAEIGMAGLRDEVRRLSLEVDAADETAFETALALANEQRLHERDVEWLAEQASAAEDELAKKRRSKPRPVKAATK